MHTKTNGKNICLRELAFFLAIYILLNFARKVNLYFQVEMQEDKYFGNYIQILRQTAMERFRKLRQPQDNFL